MARTRQGLPWCGFHDPFARGFCFGAVGYPAAWHLDDNTRFTAGLERPDWLDATGCSSLLDFRALAGLTAELPRMLCRHCCCGADQFALIAPARMSHLR